MAAIPLSEPVRPDPDPQNSVIEAGPARYGVTGSLSPDGLAMAPGPRNEKPPTLGTKSQVRGVSYGARGGS